MSTSPSPFPPGIFLPGGHNTDPPLPPSDPTTGYKLNHFMLRIRDPRPSLHFYIDLMGMRTVFTMNAGPMTIYYLGYPPDDKRENLPAWAAETAISKTLTRTLGLLELYHVHGSERREPGYISTGNQPPHLGFGHLGFTVPDVGATVERLRREGVKVVKDVGESAKRTAVPVSRWEEERGIGTQELHENYRRIIEQMAFVEDPVSISLSLSLDIYIYIC